MWFNSIYFIPPTSTGISGEGSLSRPSAFTISAEKEFSSTKAFTISGEERK